MKKNSIIGTLNMGGVLLIFASGCTPAQPDHFNIQGKIKGIDSGTVLLQRFNQEDRTIKVIDSVVFKNGTFELKGKLMDPEMMALLVKGGNWSANLFVENKAIQFDADTSGAEHFDYTLYGGSNGAVLKTVKIEGSKSQQEYDSFENDRERVRFKTAFLAMNKKMEAEKDPAAKDKLKTEYAALGTQSNAWDLKWINDFVAKNPASAVAPYLFYNYYKMNSGMAIAEMDAFLNKVGETAKQSIYYQNLTTELNGRKAVQPGKQAPEFELLKPDSTKFKLSSLKGKYVVLDFWASWCKPCREGIPAWKEAYRVYHPKGLEMVSITNDTRRSDWIHALDQEKMPWIQVADEFPIANSTGKVITQYQAPFLPFFVLIDKEGKIILRSGEEKDVVKKLKEVLN